MALMENLGKIRMVNKVKIRMKRRKISTRLFQIVIVTVVMTLFVYLIFTAGLQRASTPTDTFSWLSTRFNFVNSFKKCITIKNLIVHQESFGVLETRGSNPLGLPTAVPVPGRGAKRSHKTSCCGLLCTSKRSSQGCHKVQFLVPFA